MTKTTISDMRARGVGHFVVRCILRGEVFEVWRAGRAVAVLMPAERAAALARAERELAETLTP